MPPRPDRSGPGAASLVGSGPRRSARTHLRLSRVSQGEDSHVNPSSAVSSFRPFS